MTGWGSGPWGLTPWGSFGDDGDDLRLEIALAIRENVVRLKFNVAPLFTRTLVANDASNPERYTITPVDGTVGLDGLPTRPVRVVAVERALVELSFGAILDITVDRPLSPDPSEYIIAVNGLEGSGGGLLDPSWTSQQFLGLYRALRVQSMTNPVPSRDIANPQVRGDFDGSLAQVGSFLGTIPVSTDGDYATDEGEANLRKRCIRRVITRKNAFAHAPNYGVGVGTYGKRLAIAGIRQQLSAECEAQISLEPDVARVKVTFNTDRNDPSRTILSMRVKARSGASLNIDLPFSNR